MREAGFSLRECARSATFDGARRERRTGSSDPLLKVRNHLFGLIDLLNVAALKNDDLMSYLYSLTVVMRHEEGCQRKPFV
jgi:hypothetical protein